MNAVFLCILRVYREVSVKNKLLRIVSLLLVLVMILATLPLAGMAEGTSSAVRSSDVLDSADTYLDASEKAVAYAALLEKCDVYATLISGALDAVRGAVKGYDKEDTWYENIWNVGSGAIAGLLGLDSFSGSSENVAVYDTEEIKNLIVDLDVKIDKINERIGTLEKTMQENFERLADEINDRITESEHKAFLNEFTQVNNPQGFSYYAFFKPQLDQRYQELIVALNGGNEQNIRQAYDNLYLTAKQSAQLYYYISGESTILTGKQSVQDILYEYSLLCGAKDYESVCVEFAIDVYNTHLFAQYCMTLCYNYQLTCAQNNGETADSYYYVKQGVTQVESIQYATIPSKLLEIVARHQTVSEQTARYLSKVLRLNGSFFYESADVFMGTVPYSQTFSSPEYGAVSQTDPSGGKTVYYRVNNQVSRADVLSFCEMPLIYMSMFDPKSFSISVSDPTKAVLNEQGGVTVVGTDGAFEVIYCYGTVECYRLAFSIVSNQYDGGMGIEQAPYLVSKVSQFDGLRTKADHCYYLLTQDINYEGRLLTARKGSFGGVLDGGGHHVYNYQMEACRPSSNELGLFLFSEISRSAMIKNLVIGKKGFNNLNGRSAVYRLNTGFGGSSVDVYSSALCQVNYGVIANCAIENISLESKFRVSSSGWNFWGVEAYVGGLAARNHGVITHCSAEQSAFNCEYGSYNTECVVYFGGIAGYNSGNIYNCFSQDTTFVGIGRVTAPLSNVNSLVFYGGICANGSAGSVYSSGNSYTIYEYGSKHTSRGRLGTNGSMPPTLNDHYSTVYGWKLNEKNITALDRDIYDSLEIATLPVKTAYYYGEPLNLSGLTILLESDVNQNNCQGLAQGYTVTGYDPFCLGTQTVTVQWGMLSVPFEVTVELMAPDMGDADADGMLSIGDVTRILGYLSAPDRTLRPVERKILDCDGNGEITIADITTLLTLLSGIAQDQEETK